MKSYKTCNHLHERYTYQASEKDAGEGSLRVEGATNLTHPQLPACDRLGFTSLVTSIYCIRLTLGLISLLQLMFTGHADMGRLKPTSLLENREEWDILAS